MLCSINNPLNGTVNYYYDTVNYYDSRILHQKIEINFSWYKFNRRLII
jgi:hypothetical protein